jgi:pimeloyl-ACP methyl ester carboxylesterase
MRVLRKVAAVGACAVAFLLGGLTVLGWTERASLDLPPGVPGRHVEVDGTPIRYLQGGRGPDVLLVHGSPGTVEDWEPVFARLTTHFRVTAFDRPGHGFSGGETRPHTPAENAAVVRGLIRALGLRDVVLVGHSYGGITALELATQRAPGIKTFVVVGSRAYGPVSVDPLYRVLALPALGRGVSAVLAPFVGPSRIDAGVRESFGPNLAAMPADFVARRAPVWMRPTVTSALSEERVTLTAALDAMAPRYREIQAPVVIVCGEQDANHENARRLAAEVPGARLVLLPDTGHYVQYARPDALIGLIQEAAAAGRPEASSGLGRPVWPRSPC